MIARFFKFGFIRVAGVIIFLFLLYLLVDIFGIGKYAAQAIVIIISFLTKFTLNNLLTWADRRADSKKETLRRLILYALVGTLISTANYLIYYFLVKSGVYYLISSLISGATTSLIGFYLCDRYIWKVK